MGMDTMKRVVQGEDGLTNQAIFQISYCDELVWTSEYCGDFVQFMGALLLFFWFYVSCFFPLYYSKQTVDG